MSEIRISHRPVRATAVVIALAATLLVALLAVVVHSVSSTDHTAPATTNVLTTDYSCPLTADQVWRMVQQHRPLPQCHDRASMGGYPYAEALMP